MPQTFIILEETCFTGHTISFIAQVKLVGGLISSSLTFAEHIGYSLAAKHPYIFKQQIEEALDSLDFESSDKKISLTMAL